MKKIVLTVAGALAILATSCVSLPDAARKLDLNVDSVTFADENNVEGFNVEYTVHHNSSAPMPIENVKIEVREERKSMLKESIEKKDYSKWHYITKRLLPLNETIKKFCKEEKNVSLELKDIDSILKEEKE